MRDELTDDQIYATYYGPDGQPVRAGVVLSEDDQRLYDQYFTDTAIPQTTEENH